MSLLADMIADRIMARISFQKEIEDEYVTTAEAAGEAGWTEPIQNFLFFPRFLWWFTKILCTFAK